MEFADFDPDAFPSKERIADYLVAYADMINAPIRCDVEVREVQRNVGRPGFRIETSDGEIEANNVVAATGSFQIPVIPNLVPADTEITQIHSSSYRNLQGTLLDRHE